MQFVLNSTSKCALKYNFALPFGTYFALTKNSVFDPYDTSEYKKDFEEFSQKARAKHQLHGWLLHRAQVFHILPILIF